MTLPDFLEKRKLRRFSLSPKDAVYCIVVRSKSGGKTVALPMVDFSQTGFNFSIVPAMKEDFRQGEALFLKAIAGTRNLTFAEPIDLVVRWQRHDPLANKVNIGCEICRIATDAEKQFIEFIRSEVKFAGRWAQDIPRPGMAARAGGSPAVAAGPGQERARSRRIVSILASPRQAGSSATVVGWVEAALEVLGHRIERIHLPCLQINGCLACRRCQDPGARSGCIQKDDVARVLATMAQSDLVLLASPLYYGGLSAPLKALIDRSYSLGRGDGLHAVSPSAMAGKPCALIVTAAGSYLDNAEDALVSFRKMVAWHGAISAGALVVCHCGDPAQLGEGIQAQALTFAHQLLNADVGPRAVLIPGEVAEPARARPH